MFHNAVFKRPKAYLATEGNRIVVERAVGFVLPESLVQKCVDKIRNLREREMASQGQCPNADINVTILDVGVFSLADINIMKEWYALKERIDKVRAFLTWMNAFKLRNSDDIEKRKQVEALVAATNVYGAVSLHGYQIPLTDLTRFGMETWLSDACGFVEALQVVKQILNFYAGSGVVFHVIDPIFQHILDGPERVKVVDTKAQVLTKYKDNNVVLCPVFVDISYKHWCGAIFDFTTSTVWVYDPKFEHHTNAGVHIIKRDILPLIKPTYPLQIKTSDGQRQHDGNNCGHLYCTGLSST